MLSGGSVADEDSTQGKRLKRTARSIALKKAMSARALAQLSQRLTASGATLAR
jgi:hypothetical protein